MPTQITQSEAEGRTVLRVEGEMLTDDAVLLERIVRNMLDNDVRHIMIDLADLDFLDSESAGSLRRIASLDGVEIAGIEIFLQTVINNAEKSPQT